MVTCTIVRLASIGGDPIGQIMALIGYIDADLASSLHVIHEMRPYAIAQSSAWRDVYVFAPEVARALALGAGKHGSLLEIRQASVEPPACPERVVFTTESPVLFQGGRAGGKRANKERRPALFPCPERIFDDLTLKWEHLNEPGPPVHAKRIGGHIDEYRVTQWRAGRHLWSGWIGTITLDLAPLNDEMRQQAWQLLWFGALRGLGAKTTYGMGRIHVAPH